LQFPKHFESYRYNLEQIVSQDILSSIPSTLKSITSLPFRRFYMELHDIGLDEYLKKYLSNEDFDYHLQIRKKIYTEKNG
jgi:hypothetical protein